MSNFKERLLKEHTELESRIEKLTTFVTGQDIEKLPEIERLDLKEQLLHMQNYFYVLHKRVLRLCCNG